MNKLIGKLNPVSWFKKAPQDETVEATLDPFEITFVMSDNIELRTMHKLHEMVIDYDSEVPFDIEVAINRCYEDEGYAEKAMMKDSEAEHEEEECAEEECDEVPCEEVEHYAPDFRRTARG